MVADWWAQRSAGGSALMMARRNADVDDLNRRARRHVADAGELRGPALVVRGRPFQFGDQVISTRIDYPNGIRNGTVGTITDVDHRQLRVTISTDVADRRLGSDYVAAGTCATATRSPCTRPRAGRVITGCCSRVTTCTARWATSGSAASATPTLCTSSRTKRPTSSNTSRLVERPDPLDLVTDSLSRSAAKELAIASPEPDEIDDGADIGVWPERAVEIGASASRLTPDGCHTVQPRSVSAPERLALVRLPFSRRQLRSAPWSIHEATRKFPSIPER